MNPKDIVKVGYDKVSFTYRGDSLDENYREYQSWLDELSSLLDDGVSVLDLGCGCGIPTTKLLADTFKVTGVDISKVQIRRARKLVPDASFYSYPHFQDKNQGILRWKTRLIWSALPQRRRERRDKRRGYSSKPRTLRRMPSRRTGTLKFSSNPTRYPPSLR